MNVHLEEILSDLFVLGDQIQQTPSHDYTLTTQAPIVSSQMNLSLPLLLNYPTKPDLYMVDSSHQHAKKKVQIQSEQKRRAQIRHGFDNLRQALPNCTHKKISKVSLLNQAVQHLEYLKNNQELILNEIERLRKENQMLKCLQ